MKIIIAGSGEVGFHLAELLSLESLDITLIDLNKDKLNYAESQLDIKVIKGNSYSYSVLKRANISNSDLFIAVTGDETTNITSCCIAKKLGSKRTIARISNIEFIEKKSEMNFEEIGIDELISPSALAADEILQLLDQSAFSDSHEFEDGELTLVGTKLDETVPFVGKTVKEAASIYPDLHFMPIGIQREGTDYTIIPRGDSEFQSGDQVYFITLKEGVSEICELTGKIKELIKNVMILGGGILGFNAARDLIDNNIKVKLVEQNKIKALNISDQLPELMVIHGDGRSVDLLEEENIESMDAFISLTQNSETNIMACLMAKSKNVKKTIALVENNDYFQLSHSIGIDTIINKKLLTANEIFRYIRKGEVVDVTRLNNFNAEILEFVVKSDSQVNGMKIKDIELPRSSIIGGVIKDGRGLIVLGDYKIVENDRVVICCLPRAINKVETLFS
tara:strand:+ start:91456 stop:92805 length:1350 start_codon:yes stop_codon:yes gene_type:complete